MNHLTDAEIMAIQERAVDGVRKYADNIQRELDRTKKQLHLAESLIPAKRHYVYQMLTPLPPSYGGSE